MDPEEEQGLTDAELAAAYELIELAAGPGVDRVALDVLWAVAMDSRERSDERQRS